MKKPLLGTLALLVFVGAGCAAAPASPSAGTAPSAPTQAAPSANVLDLHGRGLTKVSMDIFSRTDLETLDLSNNALTGALPSQIGQLKKLKVLNVSGNKMTGVPAEVGHLPDLETLDLSNNALTGLPMELGELTHLKVLDVRGNPYSTRDLDGIAARLPNTEIRR